MIPPSDFKNVLLLGTDPSQLVLPENLGFYQAA
jgi:hypothetical protein